MSRYCLGLGKNVRKVGHQEKRTRKVIYNGCHKELAPLEFVGKRTTSRRGLLLGMDDGEGECKRGKEHGINRGTHGEARRLAARKERGDAAHKHGFLCKAARNDQRTK